MVEGLRIKIIFFFILVISFLIIFRLYHLQIKKGQYYEALALGQQVFFEEIGGKRGEILLNNKIVLAQTKKKNILYIFSQKIPQSDLEKTLEILSQLLEEKKENLRSLLKEKKILKREISYQKARNLKALSLKGVYLDEVWGRVYPQKKLASHLIGFLNSQGEGQYGLEGYYNEILKGEKGWQKKPVSPFGYLNLIRTFWKVFSQKENNLKGADLFLTLDYNLQYFSENLLKKAKELWDIDSGQIIITQPSTGKVFALAVFPQFDPNQYFKEKNFKIFLNPTIQELFEPGSVFKPITFAAAIQEQLITPETTYEDKGYVEVGGPPIYNFQKRVWGKQKMTDVLEESINTGAVFVEQKLGEELFLKYLEKFGFFEETEIDLQGEIFSQNENLKRAHQRDLATASFGQGIEITPFQLVRAFGAIANGGILLQPFLVEKIVKSNGEVIKIQPRAQRKVISKNTALTLTSMLTQVVESGSGRRAKIEGYLIAGKTGTAQVPTPEGGYSETETIQSFIGFFPAFNPKALIFIKLDNPKKVKTAAYSTAPLFKELAQYIINFWQLPPG